MGAIITSKDGFGWDNPTNRIDSHGRYYGCAPDGVSSGSSISYETANTKTIYVHNHTFAPVKIDKTLAINIMPTSNVWYYNQSSIPYIGIATVTVKYTLTGIIGHPSDLQTVAIKKSMNNGDHLCQVDGVVMAANLNISGYAIGDVKLTINEVKCELDEGHFSYEPNTSSSYAEVYIAYYPMHEAGV